ncbi:hypothetical protein BDW74DRAFT_181171 [Aspergillus multicolor]|uniref:uncharacterized protein n=1 Tax=Aspergillus multicolor TaxID=41759 RepID=UPI003CCD5FFF
MVYTALASGPSYPAKPEDYTLYIGLPTEKYSAKYGFILHGNKRKSCEWWTWSGAYTEPSGVQNEFHNTEQKRCKLLKMVKIGILNVEQYAAFSKLMGAYKDVQYADSYRYVQVPVHWQMQFVLRNALNQGLLREGEVRLACADGMLDFRGFFDSPDNDTDSDMHSETGSDSDGIRYTGADYPSLDIESGRLLPL